MNTTKDLMALADAYAFFMPGSKECEEKRAALESALEARQAEIERLQREVVNRNQRALDGDNAKKVLEAYLEVEEKLRAELDAIKGRKPLTNEQIEGGRKATFSTDNPFCPCTDKTMRKAVRWAERAHGIGGE